jgi:lipoyl-dependent peroxiredoxin
VASLYSTKVTASGGRHGSIHSEDGLLDLKLALPRALGGRGDATNPEQLFAGGYAACFENALLHVSRDAGHRFADDEIGVVARIDLGRNETGGFVLAAALVAMMLASTNRLPNGSSRVPMRSVPTRDTGQRRCHDLGLSPISPTDLFSCRFLGRKPPQTQLAMENRHAHA